MGSPGTSGAVDGWTRPTAPITRRAKIVVVVSEPCDNNRSHGGSFMVRVNNTPQDKITFYV